jgi:hypothetical protein
MSKLFFDHLIVREEIEVELNGYKLDAEERAELLDIVDQTITNEVMNVILNHLPKDKHRDFISLFSSMPHDLSLLDYLKQHAHPEIAEKIKTHSAKIKKDIIAEIRKSSHQRRS